MPHSLTRHTASFRKIITVSFIALSTLTPLATPAAAHAATTCTQQLCADTSADVPTAPWVKTPLAFTTSITHTGSAISNAIIDIEIYDASQTRVYQTIVEQQYLPTNQTRTFSFTWTPASTGSYTFKVGVFKEGWSGLYYWTDTAGSITVTNKPAATQSATQPINIWWPTNNATLEGMQPLKAVVDAMPVQDYTMYWSVDGGAQNKMDTSYAEYPHKEAWVDITPWTWKGKGPYIVTFVAKNSANQTIGTKQITLFNGAASTPTTLTAPVSAQATPIPALSISTSAGKPLSGMTLFVDANNPAKKQADQWRSYRPADAASMDKIAGQSQARWFGGWNGDIFSDVRNYVGQAAAANALPTLIAYNIPQRDCGGYSAGGAGSDAAYKSWIDAFANGIGNNKAIVILEPDALAGMDCLSASDKDRRMSLVSYAVNAIKSKPNAFVYIDAGHSSWVSADTMGARLNQAGIGKANGFALNVSNFYTTSANTAYGQEISKRVNNKHFVIDTARNGLGPNGSEWCNPGGRALGEKPTVNASNPLVDALLWLKTPGESDGNCNGGPSAGQWWGDYALGLAQRATW